MMETLEHRHDSEPVDPSWSEKQSAEIRSQVGKDIPGTTLSTTSCASSLCRVVLLHETTDAQMAASRKLATLPVMAPGVFYDYHTDTLPPQTVLYVLRAGTDPAKVVDPGQR
jgi:hypothetical protein